MLQRFIVCDYGAGHLTAMAILLGLYHRSMTGQAQHVEATLLQAATYHQLVFAIDYAGREWDEPSGRDAKGWSETDRLYRAADGWFYLAAPRHDDQQRLKSALQLSAILCGAALESSLSNLFASLSLKHVIERLGDACIAAHRLIEFEDLLQDPLVRERGLVVWRDHPEIGEVRATGPVPRLSRTPAQVTRPVGPPGHDSRSVLSDASQATRDAALKAAAVADRPAPGVLVWL